MSAPQTNKNKFKRKKTTLTMTFNTCISIHKIPKIKVKQKYVNKNGIGVKLVIKDKKTLIKIRSILEGQKGFISFKTHNLGSLDEIDRLSVLQFINIEILDKKIILSLFIKGPKPKLFLKNGVSWIKWPYGRLLELSEIAGVYTAVKSESLKDFQSEKQNDNEFFDPWVL